MRPRTAAARRYKERVNAGKHCEHCGEALRWGRVFCSKKCASDHRRFVVRNETCERCGSRITNKNRRFCSRACLTEWQKTDASQIAAAISHLPKETRADNNGNWRGGRTAEKRDFATQNSRKIRLWRESVFLRDGYACKDCGSTGDLEAHHIIPLVETVAFAFDRANGVTLCKGCHKKTDSWRAKGRGKRRLGKVIIIIPIPHHWQDYDTLGNWRIGTDDSAAIFVSDTGNDDETFLIALHELIEMRLCAKAGVSQAAVDAFDAGYTGDGEPGDHPWCPYREQHRKAMLVEFLVADMLGLVGYGKIA